MSDESVSLKVTSLNGVKVYHCTSGKSTPQWLKEYKGREGSLRYNAEFRNRIELIQDFEMPIAATRIKVSPDGRYIAALGTYKPRIRLYDTENLSMKLERYADADLVQMQFLSDDYSKMIIGRSDRALELHAQNGLHTVVRVPKFIRDIFYHRPTCDTYVGCSGREVYRLNLEQGSFLAPLLTTFEDGVNVIGSNPIHPLIVFGGGEGGRIECWDPRDRTRASIFDIPSSVLASHPAIARAFKQAPQPIEISALRFDDTGMNLSVGTNNGQVLTYDIRAGAPFFAKDHRYGTPINSIKYHESSGKLITADSKMVRIWEKSTGEAFTSIAAPAAINDVSLVGSSGMIMMACESPLMHSYYIPALGAVPDWCAHLEGLTEEMEETKQNDLYDDYKFVTRDQLEDWGLTHLIGTNLLRAYMHGFFMDMRLYEQVRSVTEPEDYDSYVKDQVRRKIDEERSNRISAHVKAPTVNKELAESMMVGKGKKRKDASADGEEIIDSRFASMFEDEDFAINTESDEYRRLNPHLNQRKVVSGDVKHVAKPTTDDASMGDLLTEEANPLAGRVKKVTESKGLLASAGLDFKDDEVSSKELKKREKANKVAVQEAADAKKHAEDARALLREQEIKEKLSLFANSIANKKQSVDQNKVKLRSVRSGVGVTDVLMSGDGKKASRSFAHLSLAERVQAEEKERSRVFREREWDKRKSTWADEQKTRLAEESKALSRRTMTAGTMQKKGMKLGKGSRNEYK